MTATPHDALFKAVFQQPAQAVGELQHLLPPKLVAAVDWSSLELQPGSYVDEAFAHLHSDLLFSAHALPSREPLLLYILFEHQSSLEPRMALRLLRYMVRIWTRFATDNADAPLPLILPAVLDNTSDHDLRRRTLAHQARLALWLMRDARDGAALLERLASWADDLEALAHSPGGDDALALLLRYVAITTRDLQLSDFHDILKERAPAADSITMTIAEQLLAEGRAKGRAEGQAEGELRRAAASVLTVLEARQLGVTDEVRVRVEGCRDLDVLQGWLVRATTVESAEAIFED